MGKSEMAYAEKHFEKTGFERGFDPELEKLYCGFKESGFSTKKKFNLLVSKIFDTVYMYTPTINNQILTTFEKSGNVTRILRKAIRHILEGELIKEKSKEAQVIEELFNKKDLKIGNIKDEIKLFIHRASEKTNLRLLYEKLSHPPYGLTRQIISLLLLDVLLKYKDKASLFEKGTFRLEINALLFDRLMVKPENFEVQKNIYTDKRRNYLESVASAIGIDTDNLLEITKTIVNKVKNLDKYTKQTEKLSPNALKLRNTIINAREPYKLIFNDIPVAFGFKGFENCNNEFFKQFIDSIRELDNNYALLLAEIEVFLFESFNLNKGEKGRKALVKRIKAIEEFISDDELKIIANNIKIEKLNFMRWIERLATVVNKKNVPKNWSDNDLADYKQKIIQISEAIKYLEITVSKGKLTEVPLEVDEEISSVMNTLKNFPALKKLMIINLLKGNISLEA